ncbi:acyl-CoA dehydrogenase family protein [Nocardia alni]|uniref:acyl-CoA dehydrogenase family protein n=1 Tax=Nocardia alni TaxID=2815723 RepID=UPI001C23F617|nr:acyl-CoA dehydrogenase family protein [Nocardia alni]
MRFAPTDEQLAFAEATRGFLARAATPQVVREAWSTHGIPRDLWNGLTDLGLLTMLAPEELGGAGSELELTGALEQVGRAAAPGPIVEHAAVAIPLLSAFAPELLRGNDFLREPITVSRSDVMPYIGARHALLLRGDAILRVDLGERTPLESLDDSRAVARLDADTLAAAVPVADGHDVAAAIRLAADRAALGTAAVLLGLSARATEMTVEYTGNRTQFGAPIGSFQAVKHHLANAHVAVEMARPLTEAAAWALSADDAGASTLCSMAKVTANKAARTAAKAALQCHGAIGYTMEADLHLYLMRIWSLLNAWGTTDEHRERVYASWHAPATALAAV